MGMGHFQEFASLQDRGFAPGLGFCVNARPQGTSPLTQDSVRSTTVPRDRGGTAVLAVLEASRHLAAREEVNGLGWTQDSETHTDPCSLPNRSHHAGVRGLVITWRAALSSEERADFSGHP